MLTPPPAPSISPDIAALSATYHISAAGYVDLAAVNRRAVLLRTTPFFQTLSNEEVRTNRLTEGSQLNPPLVGTTTKEIRHAGGLSGIA